MADLKISELSALAGSNLVAADELAIVDDSASETKKITVSDLIANGVTVISDDTIPGAKILFGAGDIATAALADAAVTTAKVADDAITAAKLGNESTVDLVTTLPGAGAFTGQLAFDTDDNKLYIWDGSAWQSLKAAGSVNTVSGSTTGEINIVSSVSGDTVTLSATIDNTSSANQFLAGPTGAAGAVGYRVIDGSDLPVSTSSAKGGVIVNGEGLRMDASTIEVDNDVTASSTHHVVTYNAKGLITGGRVLAASDLPIATASAVGGVIASTGLTVDGSGNLTIDNSVTADTYTKVTVAATGLVTAGSTLAASDLPNHSAGLLTSGNIPLARIADNLVTGAKLADYASAKIGETNPTADYIGQLFFNPLTRDLSLWDGNVFQPIGISAGEIVFAGTYNATTNLLSSVTSDGTGAGYVVGQALPAASNTNKNFYVVVDVGGTGTSPAPAVALAPPDFVLSTGTEYKLIDVSETVTAQVASNVGFTPVGTIAANNVQTALAEVDTEKLAKSGGTMTGNLELNDANVVFEGSTENAFETTLTVVDPTADRTITLPNVTGAVVTTGDTGTVTSTMLTDGTIVNADINASAEIAVSKLANGTARQLLQTDSGGSGVEFTSNVDVPGTLDVTGAATLDSTLGVAGLISANGKVSFPLGSAAAPSLLPGADTNTGIFSPGADALAITTGGTQRVTVDSSGNVGIGTTSPGSLLDLSHLTNAYIQQTRGSNVFILGPAGNQAADGVLLRTSSNGPLRFDTNGSNERLRITSAGKVGIGTTSPATKFVVSNGGAEGLEFGHASGTNEVSSYNRTTSARAPVAIIGQTFQVVTGNPTLNNGLFQDTSGNVGIGTTSPTAFGPTLQVAGSDPAFLLQDTATAVDYFGTNIAAGLVSNWYDDAAAWRIGTATGLAGSGYSEKLRIDSSGRVLLGTTSAQTLPTASKFQVSGNDFATSSIRQSRYESGTSGPAIILAHARGSEASNASLGNNDEFGKIRFYGHDGTDFNNWGAEIGGFVDGTPGSNDMPGRLVFSTTADGASSPSERLRIDSSGRLLVNHTADTAPAGYASKLQLCDTSYQGSSLLLRRDQNNSSAPTLLFTKTRSSSKGGSTVVQNGDLTGQIIFFAGDGTDSNCMTAYIQSAVDGTPGSNDMPGLLSFYTTSDGSTTSTERLRIDSSGRVGIGTTSPDNLLHLSASNSGIGADFTLGKNILRFEDTDTTQSNNQFTGGILFEGHDGDTGAAGLQAAITCNAASTGGNGGSQFRFYTTAGGSTINGSSTPSMVIDSSGATTFIKTVNNTAELLFGYGSSSGIYAGIGGQNNFNTNQLCDLLFYTNGSTGSRSPSERMRIDSSGRLLLGTTTLGEDFADELTIANNSHCGITIRSSSSTTGNLYFSDGTSGTAQYSGAIVYDHGSDSLELYTNGGQERMRIDSSGRVLQGLSAAKLGFFNDSNAAPVHQIQGSTYYTTAFSIFRDGAGESGPNFILAKGRQAIVQDNDNLGTISFQGHDGTTELVQGAAIKAEVDGTPGSNDMPSRLVFSTTADGASSPTERMRIDKDGQIAVFGAGNNFISKNSNAAGTSLAVFIGQHSSTSTLNGTTSIHISTNGNVRNTNNSYGSLSDIKLKENIVDAASQWNDIRDIRVRKYNFKESTNHETFTQLGVIAQEVETVSPGLVVDNPDTDNEGNDLGTVTKSVNYSVLYMKAVKALQEAMERIETLEQRLSDAGIA